MLKEEQAELSTRAVINTKFKKYQLVAGAEILGKPNGEFICSIVVLDIKTMKVIDSTTYTAPLAMKYVPGFMAFSQGPLIVNAYLKLKEKPDILIIKGHGIAHPRRIGIATQLGLQLGVPTIGVATKLLCGKVVKNNIIIEGETRGEEIVPREFAKPIYVSPGHLISIKKAIEVTKKCICTPHKMPEPLFVAHKVANKKKKL